MPWICSRPASLHKNHICAFCSYSLNTHMAFPKPVFPTISGDIKLDEPQEVPWPKRGQRRSSWPQRCRGGQQHRKGHTCNTWFWEPQKPPPLGGQGSDVMHFCFLSMFPPLSCTFCYPGSHCACPSPPKPLSLPRGTICTTHSKKTLTKRALKFSESLDPCGVTKCRSGSWSRRD